MPVNEGMANDWDSGCSNNHIGPNNTTILELHVTNIPKDVTVEELGGFFHQHSKVTPTQVVLKISAGSDHFTHAFVYFSSTSEARQGLQLNNKSLRGRNLAVSVPRRYWQHPDIPTCVNGQIVNSHVRAANRMSSYGSRSPTDKKVAPTMVVQYSPQDARSDLRRTSHQQQEYPAARGSPEVRKRKTHIPSSSNCVPGNEEQLHVNEVKCATYKLAVIPEQPVPVAHVNAQQSAPAVSPSIQQPISVELLDEDLPAKSQASGINNVLVMTPDKDATSDQPLIISLTPEVITESGWTETSKIGTSTLNSLEDVSAEGTTIIHLTPSDYPSPPKPLAAKVIIPRAVDSPSKVDEKVPTLQHTGAEKERAVDRYSR
jgi:hypothetical protein